LGGQHEQLSRGADQTAQEQGVMSTALFGISWFLWGSLCLIVALIYTVVWPRPKAAGTPALTLWRQVILRWFHALVWVLLALSCFIRPSQWLGGTTTANGLALLALLVYGIFLVTVLRDRIARH
jgi:hypothetical protein